MHIYISVIFLILGLVIASFINALIYRIDNKYKYPDIFIKGSHCEKCGKQLEWYELIPMLSYLIFRGRCKKCGYSIPIYYPISELFLGLGFGFAYYYNYPWYIYITILFLFFLSYYDRAYNGIPKVLTNIFLIFSSFIFLFNILSNYSFLLSSGILISLVLCLSLFIIGKLLRKPFGFGDILVLLGLGLLLSINMFIIFIYTFFIISSLYSITMILLKKFNRKSKIPLLPFMFISFIITMLLENIISLSSIFLL